MRDYPRIDFDTNQSKGTGLIYYYWIFVYRYHSWSPIAHINSSLYLSTGFPVKSGSHDKSEKKYERDYVPILQRQSDMSVLKALLPSSTYNIS